MRRLDKKKDRVEISVEQLLKAVSEADRLSEELQRPVHVLGWYHSHPHITVYPSHLGQYRNYILLKKQIIIKYYLNIKEYFYRY